MTHIVGGTSGWLNVKLESTGDIVALPEFLQVEKTGNHGGRDYITIVEGVHSGKEASVKESNLGTGARYRGSAKLVFDIAKGEVSYGNNKIIKAITQPRNPVPNGTHYIQLPDFPHTYGRPYLSDSPYALSWFYLGKGVAIAGRNDRYLHTGARSGGCVTVAPVSWTDLYKHLILSRTGDGKNVGTIKVL